MQPYDVTYKVGQYQNTIIIQAEDVGDLEGIRDALLLRGLLPGGAEIVSITRKE